MQNTDTIAAIATAMSQAGIGIIRVSGSEAIAAADAIFEAKKKGKKLSNAASHTIHYGTIRSGENVLDEVLVSVMRAPHTYTREDVVEINCHGGVFVLKRVLEELFRHGVRPAEPGEFTKRAFLNGRIDLSQAEAVMDIISSETDASLNCSVRQLKGGISDKVKEIRSKLIYEIAFIESALDDPEHISLEGYPEKLSGIVKGLYSDIALMRETYENGRMTKEGVKTVILGKPNVGKSSLLNYLMGEERAIVTEVAGTTRDTLEESILLDGVMLNLVDTAGIRETNDRVEQIGVEKAKKAAMEADLYLFVADASRAFDAEDAAILEEMRGKKGILLLNKTDLSQIVTKDELAAVTGMEVIEISAKNKTGLSLISDKIKELFSIGEITYNNQVVITNERHKHLLDEAMGSLRLVEESIEAGLPEDFYSIDLMNAYESMGKIIGESLEDDLADQIFSKFCMGK